MPIIQPYVIISRFIRGESSIHEIKGEGGSGKIQIGVFAMTEGRWWKGMSISEQDRRSLLHDNGSCSAFCSVRAFCAREHIHRPTLGSCTARMAIYHRTVHLVRPQRGRNY